MKIMVAALLFVALFLTSSFVQSTMADGPAADSSFCNGKCAARCANAGYKERCLKYCGICCLKCKCVPSGTYGHKEECACYSNLLNSKGKPKCP